MSEDFAVGLVGRGRTRFALSDPIPRVLAKLKEVRRRGLKSFGCERYRFKLDAALSEEEVREFEERHGVTLPEDFRRFVREVGGAGAGPYFGLYDIKHWVWGDSAGREGERLAAECPMYPGAPEEEEAPGVDYRDGTIQILPMGCAHYAVLIVTGPHRGRVVYFIEGDAPYFTKDAGFLAWYERWLDEMLMGWDTTWFGLGLPGDAAKMLQVLTSTESTAGDRAEALTTVSRIPKLEVPMENAVLACLDDPDAEVRALAADLAGRRRMGRAENALRGLCKDSATRVRSAALRALWNMEARDWSAEARRALEDTEPKVYREALYFLSREKRLKREDLEPLIASDSADKRSAAIWTWGRCGFKVSKAPWLERRMQDTEGGVRESIVGAAVAARDRAFLPRLRELARGEDRALAKVALDARGRLQFLLPFQWMLLIGLGAFLSVLAWRQPPVLIVWAVIAGIMVWNTKRRRRVG